jgi:PAS domain S-box-containing protein
MIVSDETILAGGAEAGEILRAIDWASSSIGEPERWPEELKLVVRAILASATPMKLYWGPEQIAFYNDAYIPEIGARHPQALGRPAHDWLIQSREAQARLEQTLSNAEIIGLWDWRIPEDRVYSDRRFAEMYSVDPIRAAAGAPIGEFVAGVHAEDRDRLVAAINQSMASGNPFTANYRLQTPYGQVRHVIARGQPTLKNGEAVRLAGVTIDITEQREAEIAQRDSEARYRSLLGSIDAGFCIIEMEYDADGRPTDYVFLEVNSAFEAQTGLVDAAGRRMRDLAPSHEQHWFDIYGRVAKTGESIRFINHAEALDARWFDVHAVRVGGEGSRRVALIFSDITEMKAAEFRLRESESLFRSFAQAVPNHVWTSRPDGELDWFNDRVYAYSGASAGELDGGRWIRIVHPDDVKAAGERWATAVATGNVYETEFRVRRADGAYRWHLARAVPIWSDAGEIKRWVGTNTDIEDARTAADALSQINATLESRVESRTRELMATEEQLRQAQKMEAIGQLTGGIAHDFNNLMTGIISAIALTRRRIATGKHADADQFMEAAAASAQKAASLTHRLLAFSRRQSLDVKPSDVGELAESMRDLLARTLGENVTLQIKTEDGLWPASTDANQLENAVLNLAINARDAMPDGGLLTIGLRNVSLAAGEAAANAPAGDFVRLSATDTGAGMPPDVIAHAFDPFFTTKPIGQGTGLGLSMIYGFVTQIGGHVTIESEVGAGTTVALYLPRAKSGAAREAGKLTGEAPKGQGETILLVEDDAAVRLMVKTVLSDLGYRCIETAEAQAAIPVLKADGPIDLLLSDVGVPQINGRQLADIARQHRPGLKVLFITGYAEKAAMRDGFLDPGMDLVTKPFSLDELGAKVRAMIVG